MNVESDCRWIPETEVFRSTWVEIKQSSRRTAKIHGTITPEKRADQRFLCPSCRAPALRDAWHTSMQIP